MYSKLKSLLLCFLCLLAFKAIGQKKQMKLKIMTYNIRHASPPTQPNKINIDTVVGLIKKYQPDVVALQEVDVHTGRSGKAMHEAKEIAEKLNMFYYFGKAIDYDGGEYGIAILSKYPFDSVKTYPLPSANKKAERRALALGYLRIGQDKKILFACTHLDAETDHASRIMQINTIDSIIRDQPMPVLLAGDLNSEAGSPVINILDNHFKRTCLNNCSFTIPSDKPTQTIDYIAYRKSDLFNVLNHTVIQDPFPSDHLALMAELSVSFKKRRSK